MKIKKNKQQQVDSGRRSDYEYMTHDSFGATAEFLGGETFKTIIKLGESSVKGSEKTSVKIIEFILKNKTITIPEIAQELNETTRAIEVAIAKLKKKISSSVLGLPKVVIGKLLRTKMIEQQVGSGIRNVYKYLPHYSRGATAEFVDGDNFTTIIKLGDSSEKMSEKIISLISKNPKISAAEIAEKLGKSSRTIERKISELKKNNRIKRIGPDKGGYWKAIEDKKE